MTAQSKKSPRPDDDEVFEEKHKKGVRYPNHNSGIKSAFTGAKDRTDDLIKRSENSAAKSTYDWDRFPPALLSCGFWRGDSLGLIAAEETWKQERPHWTNDQPKSIL